MEATVLDRALAPPKKEVLSGAFFWLTAFYLVYCSRPGDFFPLLGYLPLAKITGLLALFSLIFAAGRTPRRFKDLPREASYLLVIIALLFLGAFLSPVWKGGAVFSTIDFAKCYVAWVLTFLLINDFDKAQANYLSPVRFGRFSLLCGRSERPFCSSIGWGHRRFLFQSE